MWNITFWCEPMLSCVWSSSNILLYIIVFIISLNLWKFHLKHIFWDFHFCWHINDREIRSKVIRVIRNENYYCVLILFTLILGIYVFYRSSIVPFETRSRAETQLCSYTLQAILAFRSLCQNLLCPKRTMSRYSQPSSGALRSLQCNCLPFPRLPRKSESL